MLLFLRTRFALGGKKTHEFKYKNNKCVSFQPHPGGFDHVKFKESDCDNDRQPEIAIWPPKPEVLNTYISGTVIDSIKIQKAIWGFSTMTSSKKVPTNDCDNDRQPEMGI